MLTGPIKNNENLDIFINLSNLSGCPGQHVKGGHVRVKRGQLVTLVNWTE